MKIKMNPNKIILKRLGINDGGEIQAFYTDTCAKHMDKYVPMDDGNLRNNLDKHIDYIVYESPYADYQYRGMRADGTRVIKNYTTPGTGPYWDKRMKSAEMNKIVEEVQKYING